ncbi:MAG: hypothetical protein DCC66_03885 [Planctomycetota bacterium]|nr:MAG: hypothetical protein DCC66_03885 [Planctomycetota bacterium]
MRPAILKLFGGAAHLTFAAMPAVNGRTRDAACKGGWIVEEEVAECADGKIASDQPPPLPEPPAPVLALPELASVGSLVGGELVGLLKVLPVPGKKMGFCELPDPVVFRNGSALPGARGAWAKLMEPAGEAYPNPAKPSSVPQPERAATSNSVAAQPAFRALRMIMMVKLRSALASSNVDTVRLPMGMTDKAWSSDYYSIGF